MADWNAEQYLKFEDERTRPSRDLLAQIPLADARKVVDIGCGPGNSTELLVKRWPQAAVVGIDTSADMLRQARERLPGQTFIEVNVAHWVPPENTDVLFANAIFQWVPGHLKQLQRLLGALVPGGVLAVQMPDNLDEPAHVLMREVAQMGPWRETLADKARRATRCRRRAVITTLWARSARGWKSGTRSIITCSGMPLRSWNGSREPACGRSSNRWSRPSANNISPNTPPASQPAICRRRTARCCCGFREFSLWR